jgi:hypothetical protein
MDDSETDLNSLISEMNSLTAQLKHSTILDPQNLSLEEAKKLIDTADVKRWVIEGESKNQQQHLEEAELAAVVHHMSELNPEQIYSAAIAWAWYGTHYYPSPSTWHEMKATRARWRSKSV